MFTGCASRTAVGPAPAIATLHGGPMSSTATSSPQVLVGVVGAKRARSKGGGSRRWGKNTVLDSRWQVRPIGRPSSLARSIKVCSIESDVNRPGQPTCSYYVSCVVPVVVVVASPVPLTERFGPWNRFSLSLSPASSSTRAVSIIRSIPPPPTPLSKTLLLVPVDPDVGPIKAYSHVNYPARAVDKHPVATHYYPTIIPRDELQ
ncbi:hypothetical protein LX36DRAFT_405975 [Colletotrichum falcatum]|nr:hypothetical protein LX36DRAFT_405975 [Colletotrichum falcatum]